VTDGNITFDLPTGESVMRFVLKQEGEEITGEATRQRDGEKQIAKIAVKREK